MTTAAKQTSLGYDHAHYLVYFVEITFFSPTENTRPQIIYSKNVSFTVFYLRKGSENLLLGKLNEVLEVNDDGVVEVIIYKDV